MWIMRLAEPIYEVVPGRRRHSLTAVRAVLQVADDRFGGGIVQLAQAECFQRSG
ncbi:MAG TPA: hypothetical protein VKU02_25200 [Gemmataceae bacterium]|nr:hypothetical protein [Gemmataceae bacterium]